MSSESYVESVQSQFAERQRKVDEAVVMVRRIVRNFAEFDEGSIGVPMGTPVAIWREDRPDETVWFDLRGPDGEQIDRADVADGMYRKEYAVDSAEFEFSKAEGVAMTALTIETLPPNVRGYDGSSLTSPQIDGAIADLRRYEDALIAGRLYV